MGSSWLTYENAPIIIPIQVGLIKTEIHIKSMDSCLSAAKPSSLSLALLLSLLKSGLSTLHSCLFRAAIAKHMITVHAFADKLSKTH